MMERLAFQHVLSKSCLSRGVCPKHHRHRAFHQQQSLVPRGSGCVAADLLHVTWGVSYYQQGQGRAQSAREGMHGCSRGFLCCDMAHAGHVGHDRKANLQID